MKFKIISNGKVIAEFVNQTDRDLCIEVLREEYPDCEFKTEEEK
jgi:hypothetical protein